MDAAYKEIESKIVNRMIERIGDDRFDLWFEGDNSFSFNGKVLTVRSVEYFAQNRIKQSFLDDLRQVAIEVVGNSVEFEFTLVSASALQNEQKEIGSLENRRQNIDFQNSLKVTSIKPPSVNPIVPVSSSAGTIKNGSIDQSKLNTAEHAGNLRAEPQSPVVSEVVQGNIEAVANRQLLKFPSTGSDPVSGSKVTTRRAKNELDLKDFCFGDNNSLLKSAVTETVNRPGQFSPLYFFGPVGCGKTHLLRGIISAYRTQRKISRCIYMTAEQFTSNFIEAIDGRGVSDFRRKCRGLEALAIDDVQFFGGKRATLIEFQSTIEALIRDGKQILLAGDCSLAEMRCFEPELVNRIAGGLPCPIFYADENGRKSILKRLIAARNISVDQSVVDYLAKELGKDVRHLAGALNRIQAAQMSGLGPVSNIEQAHSLIFDLVQASRSSVSIREIESAVGEFCGIPPRELRSSSRSKSISTARMLAMFLSRRLTGCAFAEIGKHFGGRSHSTVISANNKIQSWLERNHFVSINFTECSVNEVVERIESKLQIG